MKTTHVVLLIISFIGVLILAGCNEKQKITDDINTLLAKKAEVESELATTMAQKSAADSELSELMKLISDGKTKLCYDIWNDTANNEYKRIDSLHIVKKRIDKSITDANSEKSNLTRELKSITNSIEYAKEVNEYTESKKHMYVIKFKVRHNGEDSDKGYFSIPVDYRYYKKVSVGTKLDGYHIGGMFSRFTITIDDKRIENGNF